MARVTVEDCVKKVPNSFELVVLAGKRAKDISSGSAITIDKKNDKDPVIALREIAEGKINPDHLRESQISELQKNNKMDEVKEENLHAENQEVSNEDLDAFSEDDNALEETFSHDEHIGEDVEMDFGDNITEGE